MRRAPLRLVAALFAASVACEEPAEAPAQHEPPVAREPEDAVRLGVPAETIHRARREVAGLERMTPGLRAQALARGRERGTPSYAALRTETSAHEGARVSYEGELGLVRPAGDGLWIVALRTRRDAERWTDPLYVLSVVRPTMAEHEQARIDGWVVGERTIGRHALPLVVAFAVEPP